MLERGKWGRRVGNWAQQTDAVLFFGNTSLIKVINGVISERRSQQTRASVNLGIATRGAPIAPRSAVLLLHGGCLCMVGFAGAYLCISGRMQGDPSPPEASPWLRFSPWRLTVVKVAAGTSRE